VSALHGQPVTAASRHGKFLAEVLRGRTERLKTALTDQALIAGVGTVYCA
jgi:formamidopyrimidine-DNA glycosylase